MPIIKSAIKRVRTAEKRRKRNEVTKRQYKEVVKTFLNHIEAGEVKEATALFPTVQKKLDMAAKKKVIEKGKASRLKSRLSKKINPEQGKK